MNSHRDNVKDAIKECFTKRKQASGEISEVVYEIADAVFDALGITSDEQDKVGGYWMLHAEKVGGVSIAPCGCGDNTLTDRHEELVKGAKYSKGEFKGHCVATRTSTGWYIHLNTSICRYGQFYAIEVQDEARLRFAEYYYPVYCTDYERSQGRDEVDKEQL